jgi:tetratricopeptide (TPR) repeat protein
LLVVVLILISCSNKNEKDTKAAEYNQKALQLSKEGSHGEALQYTTKAIELDKNDAILYYNRAILNKKLKKYEQMVDDLTIAVDLYKGSDNFLIKQYKKMLENRYYAYTNIQEYYKALNDINSLIMIDSSNADYYLVKADVYGYIDSLFLAEKDYNKAIALDSNLISAYHGRSIIYFFLKHYSKSLADLNYCLQKNDDYVYKFMRGIVFIELKLYQKSIPDIECYIQNEDKDALGYILLAIVHYKLNNKIFANEYLAKADSLKTPKEKSWEEYDKFIDKSTNIKAILKEWGKI